MMRIQVAVTGWMLFFLLPVYVAGQENRSAAMQINDVKKSGEYLYGEATMPEWAEAYQAAKAVLEANMESWSRSQEVKMDSAGYAQAGKQIKEIRAQRGSLCRAFLYIKKSELGADAGTPVPIVSVKEHVPSAGPEVQIIDLTETEAHGKPQEEKAVATKHPVESAPEEKDESPETAVEEVPSFRLNKLEADMTRVKQFAGIEPFIGRLKTEGRLVRYGKYATLPGKGKCYMFIYARSGDVVACLLKVDEALYNLSTQSADAIGNYKNCGSIWFEVKEK